MGSMLATKADIDALVSIALHWNESGQVDPLSPTERTALAVTRDSATWLGSELWRASYDSFNYGGPKEFCDPEMLDGSEYIEEMPTYEFERLSGAPTALHAASIANFYWSCCNCDAWDSEDNFYRPGTEAPPRAALFCNAMQWFGLKQLGLMATSSMPANPMHPGLAEPLERMFQLHGKQFYFGVDGMGRDAFVS